MNQVDCVSIDKFLVNGRVLQSWPELKLSGDATTSLDIIHKWAQEIQPMKQTELGIKATVDLSGPKAPDFTIQSSNVEPSGDLEEVLSN
mmetsp:Transcript_118409/g.205685  ORF Transcript_118409/g.205685 Transcript_118409/m.205685 type:complete len:89 (+) Transcript_118409:1-267(+)